MGSYWFRTKLWGFERDHIGSEPSWGVYSGIILVQNQVGGFIAGSYWFRAKLWGFERDHIGSEPSCGVLKRIILVQNQGLNTISWFPNHISLRPDGLNQGIEFLLNDIILLSLQPDGLNL